MTTASSRPSLHPWSRFTERAAGPRLHWLDAPAGPETGVLEAARLPIVFVPGFGEEALDHVGLIERISGRTPGIDAAPAGARRVLVADLRGRGPSEAPASGFDLAQHVADLDAILDAAGVDRVHVACYSRGTAYAVAWTILHADRVASLSIGDYPAEHIVPPASAAAFLAEQLRFGRPMTDRIEREVMGQIFRDCTNQAFYEALGVTELPVLLLHGGRRSSMVRPEILARYRSAIDRLETIVFRDSGHDLWRPDPDRFADCVAAFASRHDHWPAERIARVT